MTTFANWDGGKLYIGAKDDGTVIGVDNPDSVSLQISNIVRDIIKSDLTIFVQYEIVKENFLKQKGNVRNTHYTVVQK
ncbi:AlbA family DNA-binding domain-containing protein [Faecalicoccus pleomorphus]|uniref:AlbA family DNA-binding domain-containing protein n=1 Tax=Faecalicoccus TaxID=1573536 RepID=UPI0039C65951